jgi:hypothetical protein
VNPKLSPYENYRHWKWFFVYQAETPQFSTKAESELVQTYRMIWLQQGIAFEPPREVYLAKANFVKRRKAGERAVEPKPDMISGESQNKIRPNLEFLKAHLNKITEQDLELLNQYDRSFDVYGSLSAQ